MSERIVLVGAPNSGKTTLYNWLTDSRYKTVNYPGATVEVAEGETSERFGPPLFVCDTPGTYSLFPKSFDEKIAVESIYAHPIQGQASTVVAVADSTQLSRHLYVVSQLKEAGFRCVVALTNLDLLKERGEAIDLDGLSQRLQMPVVGINGQTGEGVSDLVGRLRLLQQSHQKAAKRLEPWNKDKCEMTYRGLTSLAKDVTHNTDQIMARKTAFERTRAIDSVLMHPVWGLLFFFLFMGGLFTAIFWAAKPLMDAIDFIFGWMGEKIASFFPETLLGDFLSNAVFGGLGSVMVFLPQIMILFLGICYFEDSGYLARAAALIDRPLSKLGLNGRSFVPLLSGYACAIPAMMAARTISNRKERLLTLFIIPLMSCSARLPVYALLLAFLFRHQPAWMGGLALSGIYFVSLVVGAIAAALADRILKINEKSFFMLELPVYRRPQWKTVFRQTFSRVRGYVFKAGPVIFILSLIIWAGCTFPHYEQQNKTERLTQSYAAAVGQAIEPLMEPMGFDWRVGIGLISAFAAREVFVSSLAVVFNITDQTDDEESLRESLLQKMSEAKAPDGLPLFTVASVMGLILFFMIALQCISTVGVARREFGSWSWALTQLILFNGVAYGLTVLVVQGLRAFGIS